MISLVEVSKKFGEKRILDQVTYTFKRGEITSIVAPNGTGKTTTLSIISGLLLPDVGEVIYSNKNGYRGVNIVLSGERNLYVKNTVRENLVYFGIIRGMKKKQIEEKICEYLSYFPALKNMENVMVEKLSYGQKRLISIFSAVISDADCLLLDEATEGLDMEYTEMMRNILANISRDRVVVLASHDYSFIADISKNIVFFKEGKLTEVGCGGELEELKKKYIMIYGVGERKDGKGDILGN